LGESNRMDFAGKDKAAYVQDTFDSIAKHYDLMNTLMSLGLDKRWRRLAVRQVQAEPGKQMLDVCCGTGQISLELAATVGERGKITGLDFSTKMLDVAVKNLAQSSCQGNIEFIQGDALALPFADNSFDGVTIGWGLRNLQDIDLGIREMMRVVKPGGWVVSLDMAKPTLPLFKQGYWFYFEKLVPMMGKIWSGKYGAYRYLYDSARAFPTQQALAKRFGACGLQAAGHRDLAGGVVALVYGQKPNH